MNIRALNMIGSALVILTLTAACGTTQGPRSRCAAGSSRPEAPVVCIDDTGTRLSVSPERVEAYDRDPEKQGHPMVILFFTKSGSGDFQIVPRSGNCIEPQTEHHCPPNAGLCRVHVVRKAPNDTEAEVCKYDVVMKGFTTLDPWVVTKPCCGT